MKHDSIKNWRYALVNGGILILAVLLLTACEKTNINSDDADGLLQDMTESVETEPVDPLDSLLERGDCDGYTFRLYGRENRLASLYADEETGESVHDAVFKRNQLVMDRYNIAFARTEAADNSGENAKNTILAGEDAYDLIACHGRYAFGSYGLEGLAMDWKAIPCVDLSNKWWDQDAVKELSVRNTLWAVTGDIDYDSIARTFAMLFNKTLCQKYQLLNPYANVYDGTWTLDVLFHMAEATAQDLNGDGEFTLTDDQWGYTTGGYTGPIVVLYSGGGRIVSKNEDDVPYLSIQTERNGAVFEKFFAFLDKDCAGVYPSGERVVAFSAGRILFMDCGIGSIASQRDMEDDFGVLPWPKADETDSRYSCCVDADTNLLIIPITTKDSRRTGMILEAMGAYGEQYVTNSYFESTLKSKYARDTDSAKMLNIIRESRVYDLGYYSGFGGAFQSIGKDLYEGNRDFVSYCAAKIPATEAQIAALLTDNK